MQLVGWVEQSFRDTHHRCVQMMGIAKSGSTHPTWRLRGCEDQGWLMIGWKKFKPIQIS
jgi:hypothetical protein